MKHYMKIYNLKFCFVGWEWLGHGICLLDRLSGQYVTAPDSLLVRQTAKPSGILSLSA